MTLPDRVQVAESKVIPGKGEGLIVQPPNSFKRGRIEKSSNFA